MRARARNRYRSPIKMILQPPRLWYPHRRSNRSRRAPSARTDCDSGARYRMQIANTIKRYCVFYFSRNYILSNFITRRYRLAVAHRRALGMRTRAARVNAHTHTSRRPNERRYNRRAPKRIIVNFQKLTCSVKKLEESNGREAGGLKRF